MPPNKTSIWSRDSNQTASGKSGTLHLAQIKRNYGADALQSFLGSAQLRQFFGVRDYETAELISKMLGMETLEYVDPLQRERAKHGKWQALTSFLMGSDPVQAAR